MSDKIIYKEDVYNTYGNAEAWMPKDKNGEYKYGSKENLIKLYNQGFEYLTHYDPSIPIVYQILDANGNYLPLHKIIYKELPSKPSSYTGEKVTVSNILTAITAGKTVIWHSPNGQKRITKGDPVYSLMKTGFSKQAKVSGMEIV